MKEEILDYKDVKYNCAVFLYAKHPSNNDIPVRNNI